MILNTKLSIDRGTGELSVTGGKSGKSTKTFVDIDLGCNSAVSGRSISVLVYVWGVWIYIWMVDLLFYNL